MDNIGYLPICPFEGEHPEMHIAAYKPETYRSSEDQCAAYVSDFAQDTQAWD